jgi:two-component system, chemotaxis family, protein-glutamate methylesterase/glutaminase
MARMLGTGGLGVLLTGMGDDGAEGLRDLRQAGGYTLAEDESTAVVYGMPAVAVRLGAVCESLPLAEIGPRVVSLVRDQESGVRSQESGVRSQEPGTRNQEPENQPLIPDP